MSLPDPSPPPPTSNWTNPFPPSRLKNKAEESDDDLFTVPDLECQPADSGKTSTAASQLAASGGGNSAAAAAAAAPGGKRRRGRNPVDKEYKRLKRLLRNRVSAQQARERKKVYVNDLELKARELQDKNAKLEEKILTLINENTMLRKVLMNTRPKVDESAELQNDH